MSDIVGSLLEAWASAAEKGHRQKLKYVRRANNY